MGCQGAPRDTKKVPRDVHGVPSRPPGYQKDAKESDSTNNGEARGENLRWFPPYPAGVTDGFAPGPQRISICCFFGGLEMESRQMCKNTLEIALNIMFLFDSIFYHV